MKITDGEIIKLSNGKDYICVSTITEGNIDYVLLMSDFKPLEIKFGAQEVVEGNVRIRIINNQEEKMKVLNLFKDKGLLQ